MRADLNTDSIETLRIQVDSQILTLHDSHYSSNTVTNLILFEMLEQQEFEIKKIKRSDNLCLFRITDLEDQIFTANQSDINIYLIQRKILNVLTAIKVNTKSKSKSKLNSESMSFNNDNNIKLRMISDCGQYQTTDEVKKKRLIYKMIQMWH